MLQQEAPKRILVPDPVSIQALQPLHAKGYEVDFQPELTQDQLGAAIVGKHALLLRGRLKVTPEILSRANELLVIARAGIGVNNIDFLAAKERGIFVVNTPGTNSNAVKEMVVIQMGALIRHTHEANISMSEGKWEKSKFIGTELRGKCLGILGLGNIGGALAEIALAFGMEVLGYDPYVTKERAQEMGVKLVSFEELLRGSDFLSIHVPGTAETTNWINRETLKLMKPGAHLINMARGEIVDEKALVEAIDEGRLAGAALDVFKNEPDVSKIIRSHPKILLTPHIAGSTEEAEEEGTKEAVKAVIDVFDGRVPKGAVNLPERLSQESYRKLAHLLPTAEAISTLALWLSGGRGFDQVEVEFLGKVCELEDLRPLRAAIVSGLVAPVSEQVVNIINYRQIETERGIRITEVRKETNGRYPSAFRVSLTANGEITSVLGVDAYGPRVVEVNGYPVGFDVGGKRLLICCNDDKPGKVTQVTAVLAKLNIDTMTMASRNPKDGSQMMVYTLNTDLTPEQVAKIRAIKGIRSANFYKI